MTSSDSLSNLDSEQRSKLVCGEAQYLDWYDDDPPLDNQ
ncbi:hypothetical protein K40PH129C1_LOCUS8 [Klebsiella phage vB_Kpn_K40PH129C1]|uniref:Uncharacterized protein n=1 Tax=Klebsiella phage vB_Kpn_K40PH129C1 TaxID=3071612 RepID=A0AAD2GP93_9CAUD|nr:hypothetical protein K40PH129C1_LOCUS8 [Klebsiella phage vB_Kpn_K40PH129C1]